MSDLKAFIAMGGYAMFVWPAYAVSFAVLGGLAIQSWRRYRDSMATLDQLQTSGKLR